MYIVSIIKEIRVMECQGCNDGKGLRIVRSVDDFFNWYGEEKVVSLDIMGGNFWVRDPLNGALPYCIFLN